MHFLTDINIFDYATKELSHDAVICMLFNMLNSTDDTGKSIARQFVKQIFPDINCERDDIHLLYYAKQFHHMDVFVTISINDKYYPIIIENKTESFLHDNQLQRYIESVYSLLHWQKGSKNSKYNAFEQDYIKRSDLELAQVTFVMYKTGCIFDEQRAYIQEECAKVASNIGGVALQYTILEPKNILSISCPTSSMLWYYQQYLVKSIPTERSKRFAYMHDILGRIVPDTGYFHYFCDYTYQGWISYSIAIDNQPNEEKIYYSIKFRPWDTKLIFNQYYKPAKDDISEYRQEQYNKWHSIIGKFASSLTQTQKAMFNVCKKDNKGYDRELFCIEYDDSTQDIMIQIANLFVNYFNQHHAS